MNLLVKTRIVDGSVIVMDIAGRLAAGETVLFFRSTMQEYTTKDRQRLLLNLAEVNYIDSSGLGELITTFTGLRNRGGDLKLLNPTKRIKDLLQMTKLLSVFEIFDNEAKAIQSFN